MTLLLHAYRRERGREAAAVACNFLIAQGLTVILKNFKCRCGELDLVALQDGELVIVEVKSRAAAPSGIAIVVRARKRRRIVSATEFLVAIRPELGSCAVRYDIVAVEKSESCNHSPVRWVRSAFLGSRERNLRAPCASQELEPVRSV